MTADTIRNICQTTGADGQMRGLTVQEILLREIAAQLAELNASLGWGKRDAE